MPFNSNKLSRDQLLSRFLPGYHPVALKPSSGLGGGSCIIEKGQQRRVLRQHYDPQSSEYHFLRHYHALRQLPVTLAPKAFLYHRGWMVVDYLHGEVKSTLPETAELAQVLYHLHQQRHFGWRITLTPLLERYWQTCSPARRTPFWLRQLARLKRQGEPQPLRLAPLHMDVHPGNLVYTAGGIRLIDWEYAGDGDIALELASVWMPEDALRRQLINDYAAAAHIMPSLLWQQVRRWRPWVLMLMAGWFECRWQQTCDGQFIALADEIWKQLHKSQER